MAWRHFREHWGEAAEIYDERFCRMWDFYLASCEAAFRTGEMMVFQLQVTKDGAAVPSTRDYMFASEAALFAGRNHSRTPKVLVSTTATGTQTQGSHRSILSSGAQPTSAQVGKADSG